MERREFLKKTSIAVLGLSLAGCAKEERGQKYFVTRIKPGNNLAEIQYFSTVFSLYSVADVFKFGSIGLDRVKVYRDSGDGVVRGPIDRVVFSYHSFRPLFDLSSAGETQRKFVPTPLEQSYKIVDKPPSFSIVDGMLTLFRLEDDLSVTPLKFLMAEHPELKPDSFSAQSSWKLVEDESKALFAGRVQDGLGSSRGGVLGYIYEEYPIRVEKFTQ